MPFVMRLTQVTTTVKIDKIIDIINITNNHSTSCTTNMTQRSATQPNWIQIPTPVDITQPNLHWLNTITSSSAYQLPIISTTIYYYTLMLHLTLILKQVFPFHHHHNNRLIFRYQICNNNHQYNHSYYRLHLIIP